MTPPPIMFSAEQIQDRVRGMARTIAAAPLRPDIAMPVLVGGFVFAADLLRALAWEGVALDARAELAALPWRSSARPAPSQAWSRGRRSKSPAVMCW